jgi:hypothetical protein
VTSTSPRRTTSTAGNDVRVAQTVIDEMTQLPPHQAADVAQVIQRIGDIEGSPLTIAVPGDGDRAYFAVTPAGDEAPIALYRETSAEEDGQYLVVALADRAAYLEYQQAYRRDAQNNPLAKAVAAAAAVALVSG